MTLTKGFLQPKLPFSDIPPKRKFMGPVAGSLFAVAFYALLCLLRDIFRYYTAETPEFFWNLSPEEISFYNFFFAGLASLLGQSFCISIWLNGARGMFSPPRFTRTQLIHDQWFMNWFFLSWFSKLAIVFWILFGLLFSGGHYLFSLYPHYNYLFYLILTVLFLQSWTSFRRLFLRKSLRWLSLSAMILSTFSYALSNLNFIDQAAFREAVESKSIYSRHDFNLPQASFHKRVYDDYRKIKLKLVYDEKQQHSHSSIIYNGQKVQRDSLKFILQDFLLGQYFVERGQASALLYIDRKMEIAEVEKVRKKLSETGIRDVYYMVLPQEVEYDVRYYSFLGIPDRLPHPGFWIEAYDPLPAPVFPGEEPEIRQADYEVNHVLMDTDALTDEEIARQLKARLKQNPRSIIRYRYNPGDPFENYVRMLSAANLAVQQLRAEYALLQFGKAYEDLPREQRKKTDEHYFLTFSAVPKTADI